MTILSATRLLLEGTVLLPTDSFNGLNPPAFLSQTRKAFFKSQIGYSPQVVQNVADSGTLLVHAGHFLRLASLGTGGPWTVL